MIALVDCNNFYASCERLFDPKLRGKPICVLSNNDGCVIARSNEAKELEIPMGAPYHLWKEEFKKKGVVVRSSNYALYGDISARVMTVLKSYVKRVEVYSIDEAFLDLSDQKDIVSWVHQLSKEVYKATGIPVSIGVGSSKTLAKVANKVAKSQGVKSFVITKENREKVLSRTDVSDIWGVGRQYQKFLRGEGIQTAYDLTLRQDAWIKKHMTKVGLQTADELRGFPRFPFEFVSPPKKHIIATRSFGKSTGDIQDIKQAVAFHIARAAEKLRKQQGLASGLHVSFHTSRFQPKHRYMYRAHFIELPLATSSTVTLTKYALRMVEKLFVPGYPYAKAGVGLSQISSVDSIQMSLWGQGFDSKEAKVMEVLYQINGTYGRNTLQLASAGFKQKWKLRSNFRSNRFTTSFYEILKV